MRYLCVASARRVSITGARERAIPGAGPKRKNIPLGVAGGRRGGWKVAERLSRPRDPDDPLSLSFSPCCEIFVLDLFARDFFVGYGHAGIRAVAALLNESKNERK